MGRLAEAWISPAEVRGLTRCKIKLVSLRTSGKYPVHAVLAKPGVPGTCSKLLGTGGQEWLAASGYRSLMPGR